MAVEIHIDLPEDHHIRNLLIRRITLFLALTIFLTPSALYYYYRSPKAKILTQDREYVQDINMLSRRKNIQIILTPPPEQPRGPFSQEESNIFKQLLMNFLHFFDAYLK